MLRYLLYLLIGICVLFPIISKAQADSAEIYKREWYKYSVPSDSVYGIALLDADSLLKQIHVKPVPVIVAVIDSGIDTTHVDLKNALWHNPFVVQDSDHYPHDILGWNFLGGKSGVMVLKEPSEKYRMYTYYKNRFSHITANDTNVLNTLLLQLNYMQWKQIVGSLRDDTIAYQEAKANINTVKKMYSMIQAADSLIIKDIKKDTFTMSDLENNYFSNPATQVAKFGFLDFLEGRAVDSSTTNVLLLQQLHDYVDFEQDKINVIDQPVVNTRNKITGNSDTTMQVIYYGNNNLFGTNALHGTHVSGIIAGQHVSKNGIQGICPTAQIMMIRAVPDGDEYDKDIALAIRFAVDHGAKIINMSFGKSYTMRKDWIDSAVVYAANHNVLIVHAAGNDAQNDDEVNNFPNDSIIFYNGNVADNFINVGASNDINVDTSLVAFYSNYGSNTVDVFAPGTKIYSTVPHNNYEYLSGTSMATPMVSGVAALLLSYFPSLSAVDVKNIIDSSAYQPDPSVPVYIPGTTTKTSLYNLCVSGGILDAYQAVLLAAKKEGYNVRPLY